MLSEYAVSVIITIFGVTESRFFHKPKQTSIRLRPSVRDCHKIFVKAHSEEEASEKASRKAECIIKTWRKIVQECKYARFRIKYFPTDYITTRPRKTDPFIQIDSTFCLIDKVEQCFDYASQTVEYCLENLTPKEFAEEFGYLVQPKGVTK